MFDEVMITLSWILLGMLFVYPFALAILQDVGSSKEHRDKHIRVKRFNFVYLLLLSLLVILYVDGELIGIGDVSYYAWLQP